MAANNHLLLAYYGDDFTGSTDALEFLSRAGIKTVLFMEPPTTAQLSRYSGLQAIGVAGLTRSMPPNDMEAVLKPAFNALKALGAPHVHYKVCSTFDSSPTIGSIGRAIDVGAEIFKAPFVPLLVAAPALGRYCFFGNLFARMGIGSKGEIYRLDRHPSMSRHPVTPADESDLRLHLSKQTVKTIGLLDILQISKPFEEAQTALSQTIKNGADVVLFDGQEDTHLTKIGRLIDEYSDSDSPLFSVGSSGIEMALGSYWQSIGEVGKPALWTAADEVEQLLIISGSLSPVASKQIEVALNNNFESIAINTSALASGADVGIVIVPAIQKAIESIKQGKSVIIHTSTGNHDERVPNAKTMFESRGWDAQTIRKQTPKIFGTALGLVADAVISQTHIKRLVIAGGDTSSYAARALGIEAVEMIAPLWPGAPLCKAYAPNKPVDGLQVNIKGGQVGDENYYLTVLKGKPL
ncbi:four-carbon acid sugar kinase family protein [Mucilaginibacter aquatilis]|uniref:Four-carbon acid sugar kinase family protein n=1 Tax=Mucilaginibacter aquatilis TaxID=1517760 RepID=A0A6I4ID75_9SPHI|nr:four-carbon acid sugar kinase family protein [Mucilaginibacter aquatilis]MVN93145.1 four-carbon acid sugar kinase family protein [Mucilaginibacter aquatilis]